MSEHTCGGRGDVPCLVCTANAAQAAYAAAWRAEHPNEVYTKEYECPLCGYVLLSPPGVGAYPALFNPIAQHQQMHGESWGLYVAAGADRATGDGGGEGEG